VSVRQINDRTWVDDYNQLIVNVHQNGQCKNSHCTIHNSSEHPMIGFPQRWRQDFSYMERICPHGIGHPDPDDIVINRVHGCDGCCSSG
jgi:hypothetical protein